MINTVAIQASGLKGPLTRTEQYKFIRRLIGSPLSVARPYDVGAECPLRTRRTVPWTSWALKLTICLLRCCISPNYQQGNGVFQQQLVHVQNGCISADPNTLVQVGTTNYHNTGHHLNHYQSLRGTSKVEAVHSVLDRTLIPTENSCCLLDPFLSVPSRRS